jgi:hypothetical protein
MDLILALGLAGLFLLALYAGVKELLAHRHWRHAVRLALERTPQFAHQVSHLERLYRRP